MATINDLSFNDTPQSSDSVPVYGTSSGMTQRTSVGLMLQGGLSSLPTVQPVDGSGELWIDPFDGNAIKAAIGPSNNGGVDLTQTVVNIAKGTATDAGTLTGAEIAPVSRSGGALQTTLAKIAAFVTQIFSADWLNTTGSAPVTPANFFAKFVTPDHFSLVGDGSDETSKLVALISYAARNRVAIHWNQSGAVYGFTNIGVFVGGGMFKWVGKPKFQQLSTATFTNNAIEIGGASVATISVTATANAGSTSFTVSDASQIQPGYLMRLTTNRLMYGDHRFDANNAFSQLVKVRSVSGNTVTVYDPLVFDFPVASVTTGTAQGGTSGTITLAAGDTATAQQLNCLLLTITAGTGAGQSRYINTYNATTKVADIGTTFTQYAQAPWATIPDATSQYSVTQTVTAVVYQPAETAPLTFDAVGYSALNLVVQGCQISFCDRPVLFGSTITGFSNKALYTYRNYKPKIMGCQLSGANYGTSTGDGLGYGHVSLGDFACQVIGNSFDNNRTACDAVGGSVYLTRIGNTITGGGTTYDGGSFWPANSNYINSGLSCHSGAFGITDQGNTICDVFDNKQRGLKHSLLSNTLRGQIGEGFEFSYSDGGVVSDNRYDDGVTQIPSNGMNANTNGTEGPSIATLANRAQCLVRVRQSTMVSLASVEVSNNYAKSLLEALVYVTDVSSTSDLALEVTGNRASIIPAATLTAAVVKPNSGTVGATALRQFTAYGNDIHVGGSVLGTAKADNMNKYPIIDLLPTTAPLSMQTGLSQWTLILPVNTATNIAVPLGQNLFKLRVFEKDYAVTNMFEGIVQRGNTTPIVSSTSSGIGFSTSVLTGTTGTAGNVTISNRTDGTMYVENRTASTVKLMVIVEGAAIG